MTRVMWKPRTNTQRQAVKQFGGEWVRVPQFSNQTFSGVECMFIMPVGIRNQARWVEASIVREVPDMPETATR